MNCESLYKQNVTEIILTICLILQYVWNILTYKRPEVNDSSSSLAFIKEGLLQMCIRDRNDVMQRDALQFTALQKFSNDGQPKDIIMSIVLYKVKNKCK